MIAQLRKRPLFSANHLTLRHSDGEYNIVPDEFVPHTVILSRPAFDKFVFEFDYSIDEDVDKPVVYDDSAEYHLGRYSRKVLKIVLTCQGSKCLHDHIVRASHRLKLLLQDLQNDSFKRNYELVNQALRVIGKDISEDPSKIPSYKS